MRTAQELFDTVAAHLLTQNAKSINAHQKCLYRDGHGRTCAIGCLIPNHRYDEDLEQRTVFSRAVQHAANIPEDLVDLAQQLQQVHDQDPVSEWRMALDYIAQIHQLNRAVLGAP